MSTDLDAAIDFRRRWAPDQDWIITTFDPLDDRKIESETFSPGEAADKEMRKWLGARTGKLNCYFQINPMMRRISGKGARPSRKDVLALVGLFADIDFKKIDPALGPEAVHEHMGKQFDECLAVFTTRRPAHIPPPTWIAFTGGGLQAGWKLEQVPVGGNIETANRLAAEYGAQLVADLTAVAKATGHKCDPVQNLDRLADKWGLGTCRPPTRSLRAAASHWRRSSKPIGR